MNKYPKINYIGNKEKISEWIIDCFPIKSGTVLDLFCGGCSVSYALKHRGYKVFCNDILFSNYVIAKSIIENNSTTLQKNDYLPYIDTCDYNDIFQKLSFLSNKLYFDYEIEELAKLVKVSASLKDYKKYLFLTLIRRAMIRKLPYSRMNIKWEEIVKLRDEEYSYKKYGRYRHYHNLSFIEHINNNLENYNSSIINTVKDCKAYNLDAIECLSKIDEPLDLIYLDPPYPSTMNNYDGFYGIFDKIFNAETISSHIDLTNKKTFLDNFTKIINKCIGKTKYIAISLNNRCFPSKEELLMGITDCIDSYTIFSTAHKYKVTGKTNKNSNCELLIICKLRNLK